jgi:DNA-binding NtrC family response regulator
VIVYNIFQGGKMVSLYRPRVLLLDDRADEVSTIAYYLSKGGLDVTTAYSESEARGHLGITNIDVILVKVDVDENSSFMGFIKKNAYSYPVILIGSEKKRDIPKEWKSFSSHYIEDINYEKNLVQAVFAVVESRKSSKAA